jgi:hypothetical protein
MKEFRFCSLSLWERVRVRAGAFDKHPAFAWAAALTPTLSQREREQSGERALRGNGGTP